MQEQYSWSDAPDTSLDTTLSGGKPISDNYNPVTYTPSPLVVPKSYINPNSGYYDPYTSEYITNNIILSTTSSYNDDDFIDSPYVTSVGYDMYGTPVLGIYKNLNADPYVRERMIELYYYKTLEKWLEDEMKDVLNYLQIVKDEVKLLNSLDDYKTNNSDNSDVVDRKIKYIKKNFVTRDFIKKVIKKYIKESQRNWYDLATRSNDFNLRGEIKDALIEDIKKVIRLK